MDNEGAAAFEHWCSMEYPKIWHQVWKEGFNAHESGVSRQDNPHKLKVWRAVWEYGWDNYYPGGM